MIACASVSNAQSLDNSFGINGTVTHSNFGNWFEATELADGSMILSGDYETDDVSQAIITKLKPDGTIDTSFASGGKYVIDQFADVDYYETFSKATLLPDGKLLFLYGAEYDNDIDPETYSVKIIRLNANGTVDNTFVSYSQQNISEDDAPYGIFNLPSGKILIYGYNYLKRFNANGTLDTSYANNGTRTIAFDIDDIKMIGNAIYLYDYSNKRLIKLDDESATTTKTYNLPQNSSFYFNGNNIYIYAYDTSSNTISIQKIDSNFAPVGSFGYNGTAVLPNNIGYNLVFQPQGSIIAGNVYSEYDNNGDLINSSIQYRRINPNGTQDSTFGVAGVYTINIPNDAPYNYWSNDYVHSNGKLYHLFYDKDWETNNIYIKRSNLPNEVLAVAENALAKDIRIIQNPVREILQLSDSITNAKIYDMSGKETGITFEGHQTSVGNLKPGVYIINAKSESGKKVNLKFIKK